MTRRKIRVHVEIWSPNDSTDYFDLPDNWDEMTPKEREDELTEMAVEALANAAGSSATLVEVDEHDNEIRIIDEETETR